MDFVLRSQQPAAYQVLKGAGISAGKELTAVYLIVGPHAATSDAVLLAGLGTLDGARPGGQPAQKGGTPHPGPRAPPVFGWPGAAGGSVGSVVPVKGAAPLGDAAVGVADQLILLGPPNAVRQALSARAGEVSDVREGSLVRELLAVDTTAVAWGAIHGEGKD